MRDKSLFGIILVLLGLGFLLDQFNIISFNNIITTYWPIILILIGIIGFFNKKSSKMVNFLLIVFGMLFQARNLDLIDVNIFSIFWPVILIIIGISIIFPKNNFSTNKEDLSKDGKNKNLDDSIDEFVIMSGLEARIESQEFKGGKITSIMAGIELDLRDSKLYNNEATININSLMSGVEIYVPENWKIEHNGSPIMGEFSNKKRYKEDLNPPILRINFSIIMGSIEIK